MVVKNVDLKILQIIKDIIIKNLLKKQLKFMEKNMTIQMLII